MRRAGFTLIELLVVVAIMGIMVTAGVLTFTSSKGSHQLFAAARDVMAAVRNARSIALVTQKPVVVTYENSKGGEDVAAHAQITTKAQKLFDSSKSEGRIETLDGDIVGGEEEAASNAKTGEDGLAEGEGETLEDMLTPKELPPDVLEGVKIKVLDETEVLQTETVYRSRISIFSTADSVSRTYGGNTEKKDDKTDGLAEATEEKFEVVFAANGTVNPAHKIWIYTEETKPEDGLCITVDRFGEPRCADLKDL